MTRIYYGFNPYSSAFICVFTGHLPLDASIRNQPRDGDKDVKKARDRRARKGEWDRDHIAHDRDFAFEV
jgi:hypothetical protein